MISGDEHATFDDRVDAGNHLADAIAGIPDDALVLGIPRGGVVVAAQIARLRDAELDIVVARKLGAPANRELAIGAVAPDGEVEIDDRVIAHIGGVPEGYIADVRAREVVELERRLREYRGGRVPLDVAGRSCVLVDDGIATGATARACLRWLRRCGADPVVLAVPVAPADVVRELASETDAVLCLHTPTMFQAVGQWYARFDEVRDEDVVALLEENRATRFPAPPE